MNGNQSSEDPEKRDGEGGTGGVSKPTWHLNCFLDLCLLPPVLEMDFEGYSPGRSASQCGTVEFHSKPAMQIGH